MPSKKGIQVRATRQKALSSRKGRFKIPLASFNNSDKEFCLVSFFLKLLVIS